jgi:hypothetical protein
MDQHGPDVRFVPEVDIDRAMPYRSLSTAPARQIAASIAKLQGTTSLPQAPRLVLRQNRRQYQEQ